MEIVSPLGVPHPSCLPPGTEVGGFRVLQPCGQGTSGAVYLAHKHEEGKEVRAALKVALHPEDARFAREAELLARVHHPGIPQLWAYGQWQRPDGAFPFLAMEWVEGTPLYATAQGAERSSRQVARWVGQLASALACLHAAGGLHRDVKGGNILVRAQDSRAMLVDFGAGDYLGAGTLTQGVLPPGTHLYRSPEALRFEARHWRTAHLCYEPEGSDDVYALGVTAWKLLTGLYPAWHPASRAGASRRQPIAVISTQVPLDTLVTVHPELASCIHLMLSAKASSRPSAAQVARVLERLVEQGGPEVDGLVVPRPALSPWLVKAWRGPERRRPWRLWRAEVAYAGGALAALGLLSHAVWAAWPPDIHWPQYTPSREQPDGGVPDAGTSGVGSEAAAVSVSVETPPISGHALRAQMPKQPMSNQVRPPCEKREVEINGGCWWFHSDSPLPCAPREYEWQGLCYFPVLTSERPRTSDQPQRQ